MKRISLQKLIQSFTPAEYKEFGRFIGSPLYNTNGTIIMLHNILKNYIKPNSRIFSKETLYKKLFPGKKFNEQTMRNLSGEIVRLSKRYFIYRELKNSPLESSKFLLKQLSKRNLQTYFEKELQSAYDLLEHSKTQEEEYYLNKYHLCHLERIFYMNKFPVGKSQKIYNILTTEVDNIIYFFLILMLKEYSNILNTNGVVKLGFKERILKVIREHISLEEKTYMKIPLVKILHTSLKLYEDIPDENLYQEMKDLLEKHKRKLSLELCKDLYTNLYNYCKDRQAAGDKRYGEISFELMKDMLEKNLFFEDDGYMLDHTYINLAASGIRVKEMEWAEEFINNFKSKVYAEVRENAFNYVNSVFNYMKSYDFESPVLKRKQYDVSLDYLKKVKVNDFYWMARIKNHELKIYFEMNEMEPAIYLIDTYRHYLAKNKLIPEELRERYYNYIYHTEKLIKLKTGMSQELPERLRDIVSKCERMENRGWVMEKIDEMK